jgi:hypothetical protein
MAQKAPIYTSMSSCSGRTGIPLATIKNAKNEGCTAFTDSGRVDLEVLLKHLFKREEGDPTDWGADFEKWRAKREKIKHDKDADLVADKVETSEGIKASMAMLFGELDRVFCSELPPAVKGLEELAIRARSQQAIAKLKKMFEGRIEELIK